jgi:hypothetical protein
MDERFDRTAVLALECGDSARVNQYVAEVQPTVRCPEHGFQRFVAEPDLPDPEAGREAGQ